MKKLSAVLFFISFCFFTNAQTIKILFDATKAESAGNADWVIDANSHNLGYGSGPAVLNGGSESNAQQIPLPAQSGITSSTSETYWNGALSYWGVDCVLRNYTVETLPYNGQITYGNGSNPQDLSNYNVFIVCEPNIVFTASEKSAIINFVQNGGGLFMVSDHNISDRNNDGWDSPHIWNDLMVNNSVHANPFGISFDYTDFSLTTSNIPSLPGDSILHGPAGNVAQAKFVNGTSLTLNTSQNSTAKGVVYKTGSSFGNTGVMCAYARFGSGKVAALGDSSPCDDGTGDSGDQLYNGYITDAGGNHRKLLMNITIWLATTSSPTQPVADFTASPLSVCIGQSTIFTNSSSGSITSYSWNFGSGATPATSSSSGPVSVTYASSGTKTVSLTVTGPGGSSTATKSNYISVPVSCTSKDIGVFSLLDPASSICPEPSQVLQVRIKNYGATTIDFSLLNATVTLKAINPSSIQQNFTKTLNSGTLVSGSTLDVTFASTYDMSVPGNYSLTGFTSIASDANTLNDTMPPVSVIVSQGFLSDYTVMTENMGTVSTTTTITQLETNGGFENDNLTMSGNADVRTTVQSSGYTTASAGANVFFTNTAGKNFIIQGIDASPFSNLSLSFGIYNGTSGSTGSDFSVKVSSDGTSYTSLSIPPLPTALGWYYVTATGAIPSASNLRIQFIQNGSTNQYRVDDVLLVNKITAPVISPQGPVNLCQGGSVVLTATPTISYLWSNGATTQSVTVISSGTYSVTETNESGCTITTSPVSVIVNPVFTNTVNVSICPGSNYTLPDGIIVSTSATYTSILQSVAGCDSTIITNLTVIQTNDNNACTLDACNTFNGSVTHTLINTDDSNACTTDACNTGTGAVTHIAVSVDDGNGCTTDACNTSTGAITHIAVSVDDGDGCTTDACNTSTGVITHTAINISDGNSCTMDACATSTGVITHTAISVDDGNACTVDACNTSTGAITHIAVSVDDGDGCTTDACNTSTGAITHTAINISDGNSCTTDACATSTGVITHTAISVDDGNACTADACNTSTGGITNTIISVDDGNACTIDACNTSTGVITNTAVLIDDGNACSDDVCNTLTGIITHTNINVDDGNACTTDACNSLSGSVTHEVIIIDDGNACTNDFCNSLTGTIDHIPVNPDDNNICTLDGCDSITGIFHSVPPEICNNGIDDNCNGSIDEGCSVSLQLRIFIEGYYRGNNTMIAVVDPNNYPTLCDTIDVELRNPAFPFAVEYHSKNTIDVDGYGSFNFPSSVSGMDYLISIHQRNTLNTWSAAAVHFGTTLVNYSFTDASNKAFGNNLHDLGDGNFALFSGDVNQNGIIDTIDFSSDLMHAGLFETGYSAFDLTGDAFIESADISLMENNIGKVSMRP